CGWMDVLGAHTISRPETGRGLCLPVERAARHPFLAILDQVRRELARERLAAAQCVARRKLVRTGVTALDEVALHGQRPALVIGRGKIGAWRELLLREAGRIDGPRPGIAERALHRQHAAFPRGMKDRFV